MFEAKLMLIVRYGSTDFYVGIDAKSTCSFGTTKAKAHRFTYDEVIAQFGPLVVQEFTSAIWFNAVAV